MRDIIYRLNKIEEKITKEGFLNNKGLGNEVGYYIFDYDPRDELQVRNHVAYLKEKINKTKHSFKIIEFDLYNLMIQLLMEEGYFEDCLELEKSDGAYELFEATRAALGLTEDQEQLENNLVITSILNRMKEEEERPEKVIFLTGVGKCFPIIRSHNILNNLHQVLDNSPVIMFFPGNYSGQALQLFGTIKDDNYYRAFRLIEREGK